MAKKFEYELIIRENHLDSFGHVNHATYLVILEEARWEIITQNGYGLTQIESTGLGPVILEVHIKYRKELRLRERIRIETQCMDYKSKIGTFHQKIFNEKGEVCCEAKITSGLFDLKTRRLVSPPAQWLQAIGWPE